MLLFVYGTLQRGCPENKILTNAKLSHEGYIYATLYDLGVDFPGAVADNTGNKTWGEVYEVDEGLLDELDEFEGYYPDDPEESLYRREIVTVYSGREKIEASAYLLTDAKLKEFFATEIKNGRWQK